MSSFDFVKSIVLQRKYILEKINNKTHSWEFFPQKPLHYGTIPVQKSLLKVINWIFQFLSIQSVYFSEYDPAHFKHLKHLVFHYITSLNKCFYNLIKRWVTLITTKQQCLQVEHDSRILRPETVSIVRQLKWKNPLKFILLRSGK